MSRSFSPVTAAAMAAVVAMTLFALWAGNARFEAAAAGTCGAMGCSAGHGASHGIKALF